MSSSTRRERPRPRGLCGCPHTQRSMCGAQIPRQIHRAKVRPNCFTSSPLSRPPPPPRGALVQLLISSKRDVARQARPAPPSPTPAPYRLYRAAPPSAAGARQGRSPNDEPIRLRGGPPGRYERPQHGLAWRTISSTRSYLEPHNLTA